MRCKGSPRLPQNHAVPDALGSAARARALQLVQRLLRVPISNVHNI